MTDSSTPPRTDSNPAPLEAEIRTFLIADVRGYTRFTQERGDEAAARLASKFAALAREGVARFGGEVVELRGDEALVMFRSSRQALRAALELQRRFAAETAADPSLPLKVGIGLDAGEAVRVEGGYRGGALNLAARLCSLAGPGEILASDGLVHLARRMDDVAYVEREPVQLKGFTQAVPVIEVVPRLESAEEGVRDSTEQQRTADVSPVQRPVGTFLGALPTGPLIAREEERSRIMSAIEGAIQGSGQTLLLVGESGIGKTRLAQEAALEASKAGFAVAMVRCMEASRDQAYGCFREILPALLAAAPGSMRSSLARRRPDLQRLIDAAGSASGRTPGEPVDERQIQVAVSELVDAVTPIRPVAVLVDDLQWADDRSRSLLRHLAEQAKGRRLLLLATTPDLSALRDNPALKELVQGLTRNRLAERIVLTSFSAQDTAEMISAAMGAGGASQDFMEFVHRRTGGNPGAIDGMVRSLGGRLKLVCEIGAGGMGRVFRAIDSASGRTVAAKIMFAYGDVDLDTLLRFQQEGAVLSTLKHPHIVRVYGSFLEEYASCIIMELLEGQALSDLLVREDLSLGRVKTIVRQTASALAYAHGRGIVHRDVKPDNIMVSSRDEVKVTDFGIARVLRTEGMQSITKTGMAMGTPLYMAPEQIEGHKVDGRADIYSLGAVMYELVTGRPPFEGDSPFTIAVKHISEPPPPPRQVKGDVPQDWEAVILKTLAKDPAERFQSAAEIEEAVAALSTPVVRGTPRRGTGAPNVRDLPTMAQAREAAPAAGRASAPAASGPAPLQMKNEPEVSGPPPSAPVHAPPDDSGRATPVPPRTRPWKPFAVGAAIVIVALLAVVLLVRPGSSSPRPPAPAVAGAGSVTQPLWAYGVAGSGPGQFEHPAGIAVDGQGNVYVADTGNSRLQELAASTDPIAQWGAKGEFDHPGGVAAAPSGRLYVVDTDRNRVVELSSNGKLLRSWGSKGSGSGQFDSPAGIAVGPDGTVYVADTNNDRVETFFPGGRFQAAWGSTGSDPGQFHHPSSVAVDAQGDVFVADTGNNRVQELAPTSDPLNQWGTEGSGALQFRQPRGIAVDGRGYLYVADTGNNRIEVLTPGGKPYRVLGTRAGSKPGEFAGPTGVALDPTRSLYISDTGNDRIQKFRPVRP